MKTAASKSTRTMSLTYSCRGVATRRKARAVTVIWLAMACVAYPLRLVDRAAVDTEAARVEAISRPLGHDLGLAA